MQAQLIQILTTPPPIHRSRFWKPRRLWPSTCCTKSIRCSCLARTHLFLNHLSLRHLAPGRRSIGCSSRPRLAARLAHIAQRPAWSPTSGLFRRRVRRILPPCLLDRPSQSTARPRRACRCTPCRENSKTTQWLLLVNSAQIANWGWLAQLSQRKSLSAVVQRLVSLQGCGRA